MSEKKRILFVDDEPMVLQGLQRMLRGMRAEWDMVFVTSGAEALQRMDEAHFDVIVSDMRMPGMNGAELLNEVMKRHPKTIRLVLSGHADKDLILQCVGSTHQYLAKPCDAEALKATLHRATSMQRSLNNEHLKQLVAQMDRLPSVPSVYSEIVERLRDPDITLEEVGEVVAKDIGMTAKILKLVNSAFFGLRRGISHPAEAVAYLGLDTVKSLVLAVNAFSQFEDIELEGFSMAGLWSHSMEVAGTAKAIARSLNAERKVYDECFVAGMLHDAGKLVLAANFADRYAEALRLSRQENLTLMEAEQRVFGVNHADVGGYLLGLWGLPVPVVEAIGWHHEPGQTSHSGFSPLTAVHVANALCHLWSDTEPPAGTDRLDHAYVQSLGLADRLDEWKTTCKPGQEAAAQAA